MVLYPIILSISLKQVPFSEECATNSQWEFIYKYSFYILLKCVALNLYILIP